MWLLTLLLVLPCTVSARDYRLEVILKSYHNPLNLDNGGRCCEEQNLQSCPQLFFFCSKICDPYFTITASGSGLSYTTPVYLDTDQINFPRNLYLFHGNDSVWMDGIAIINVSVDDYDGDNPFFFSTNLGKLNISTAPRDDCLFHSNKTTGPHFCGGYIELNISYRILETTSSCLNQTTCSEQTIHGLPMPTTTVITSTYLTVQTVATTSILVTVSQCSSAPATIPPEVSCSLTPPIEAVVHSSPTLPPSSSSSSSSSLSTSMSPMVSSGAGDGRDGGGNTAAVCGASATGGFLVGLLLTLTTSLLILACIRRRKRSSRNKSRYLRRSEANPLYQSAENLVDRGNLIQKQFQDSRDENDGGYDTLKSLPLPLASTGKLLPISKKENGFMYCLSPTDPQVPLRPVPSPRMVHQHPSKRNKLATGEKSDREFNRRRPCNFPFNSTSVSPAPQSSPIYEMPDKFIHTGHHFKPPASSPPPDLPGRTNVQRKANAADNPSSKPHPPPSDQREQEFPPVNPTACNSDTKDESLITGTSGRQRKGESRQQEMELKDFTSRDTVAGVEQTDREGEITTAPGDLSALYANVGKDGAVRMRRESSPPPPEVPPYKGGGGEGAMAEVDGEDGDSECPPSTPFIN